MGWAVTDETALVPAGKVALVFDVDGAQYCGGEPCSLCGIRQTPTGKPRAFVRVRQKVKGGTRELNWICPDCVGRLVMQVEKLGLWSEMSPAVQGAITRMLARRRRVLARKP